MDALKRAEEAKRNGRQDTAGTDFSSLATLADGQAAPAAPDPRPITDQIPQALPDLPLTLEQLDEQLAARAATRPPAFARTSDPAPTRPAPAVAPPESPVASPAAPASPTAADTISRAAAQNVFAAKQPAQAARNGHTAGLAVGAAALVAVGAIGVYFWLQLRPVPRSAMIQPMAPVKADVASPARRRQPDGGRRAAAAGAGTGSPATCREHPGATARRRGADHREPDPHLGLHRMKVNPAAAEAYEAFQAGDVARAARGYELALQADPRNADALLGAAAIALRQGRNADAENYYLRLLEASPGNAAALAGLQGLRAPTDPVAAETRLKSMLAAQPDAPSLHFALGNLYARQSRWSDAQQAYFKAVTGDADNPDYLFNLAVSLDQLHQPRLAAQYYRQALTAAATRPAGFDQDKAAGAIARHAAIGAAGNRRGRQHEGDELTDSHSTPDRPDPDRAGRDHRGPVAHRAAGADAAPTSRWASCWSRWASFPRQRCAMRWANRWARNPSTSATPSSIRPHCAWCRGISPSATSCCRSTTTPEQHRLTIAIADPNDIVALDKLRTLMPQELLIETLLAGESEIARAIDQYYGHELSIDGILHEIETGEIDYRSLGASADEYSQPVVRLVDALLTDAVKREASDIHFEPEANFLRIRYRIDGILRQIRALHKSYWAAMAVRIKVMSGMNIAETRAPQDGRISLNISGRQVDFRVAAQPTIHGENVVLRILDRQKGIVPLDRLGLDDRQLEMLKLMVARPEGIILVTGPTGSGKTTTLYSVLNHINQEGQNIMTLEDPVEYPMAMIRQTSVAEAAKLDFANGIRSMMRQDPDVILVGEIRDADTAEMAFRAAMTGHQVYSTLHTNSAHRRHPAPARHRHPAGHHGRQHHRHRRPAPGAPALSALPQALHRRRRTSAACSALDRPGPSPVLYRAGRLRLLRLPGLSRPPGDHGTAAPGRRSRRTDRPSRHDPRDTQCRAGQGFPPAGRRRPAARARRLDLARGSRSRGRPDGADVAPGTRTTLTWPCSPTRR